MLNKYTCNLLNLSRLLTPHFVCLPIVYCVYTCAILCIECVWSALAEKPHICERKCHEGPCGSCDLTTELTCRCTKFKKEFPCTEVMKLKGTGEFTNLIWKKANYFIKKNLRICLQEGILLMYVE